MDSRVGSSTYSYLCPFNQEIERANHSVFATVSDPNLTRLIGVR